MGCSSARSRPRDGGGILRGPVVLAFSPALQDGCLRHRSPNSCIPSVGGRSHLSKSSPQETFLKSHWPELGHVPSPKVVVVGKGERAGLPADPPLSTQHPIPEHGGGSAGRKMVGVSVQLETHQAARPRWKFCVFLASALFLTRNIILSKPVSHRALLTEAWWIISTSVQIPRETQMPGKGYGKETLGCPWKGVVSSRQELGHWVNGEGLGWGHVCRDMVINGFYSFAI